MTLLKAAFLLQKMQEHPILHKIYE